MPERGWSVLTVREDTARRIKKIARTKGLTLDEMIAEFISLTRKEGWSICDACGMKVKTSNLHEHVRKLHPKLTVKV